MTFLDMNERHEYAHNVPQFFINDVANIVYIESTGFFTQSGALLL